MRKKALKLPKNYQTKSLEKPKPTKLRSKFAAACGMEIMRYCKLDDLKASNSSVPRWVGLEADDVDYECAGINHLAWYLRLEHKGKDLYPELRKVVTKDKKIYNEEQVRNEMFLALGYYVTESSGHNSEYNWWFRKRPDLIEKYCTTGTGWNPGHPAFILNEYRRADKTWKKQARE